MKKELDSAKAEAFGGRLLSLLNDSMLSLAMSIGHRTKRFDKLALMPPSTSVDIARACELDERDVRESLGAMVMGKIIDYDADPSCQRARSIRRCRRCTA